jgi:MGT family glycosyltransferase
MRILSSAPSQAGHLNPILGIALQARQAGHEVLVTAAESTRPRLDALSLRLHAAGVDMDDPDVQAFLQSGRTNAPGAMNEFFGLTAGKAFDSVAEAIDAFQPDLIVSSAFDLAAVTLAERAGVPRAVFGFAGTVASEHVARNLATAHRELRARAGLSGDGVESLLSADWIFGGLPAFAPEGARLPERAHFVRPTSESRNTAGEDAPEWVSGLAGKRSVYFTFGTAMASIRPGYMETVVAGLAAAELDAVVVTTGPARDPAAFGTLPDTFRVERYIPQAFVLPKVAACVSHAGYSVMSAVGEGLPLLLVPFGSDQPSNAAALARVGVALQIDKDEMTPETVRDAITRLLGEGSFRTRAQAVARELGALPEVGAVLNVIASR